MPLQYCDSDVQKPFPAPQSGDLDSGWDLKAALHMKVLWLAFENVVIEAMFGGIQRPRLVYMTLTFSIFRPGREYLIKMVRAF